MGEEREKSLQQISRSNTYVETVNCVKSVSDRVTSIAWKRGANKRGNREILWQPRPQGFSLKKWVGKSPGDEVDIMASFITSWGSVSSFPLHLPLIPLFCSLSLSLQLSRNNSIGNALLAFALYSRRLLRSLLGPLYVFGKLPTYPSPRPTLTLTSHLRQNVGLGEG